MVTGAAARAKVAVAKEAVTIVITVTAIVTDVAVIEIAIAKAATVVARRSRIALEHHKNDHAGVGKLVRP